MTENNNNYWDRPKMGDIPFVSQVWCCGYADEAYILSEIIGWAEDSWMAGKYCSAINNLIKRQFIRKRIHKTNMNTEWKSYALTEEGFERLAKIGYGMMHDIAVEYHRFYAERGSL